MGHLGYDAGYAGRVGLRWACGGGVHDGVLGGAEEVSRATKTVQDARTHDAGGVGVGVDINFDGCVHAIVELAMRFYVDYSADIPNNTKTADNLRRVRHLLRTEQKLWYVVLPALVEALEALRRETNRCGGSEVKVARVEQVEERVLQNLGPDLQVLEVGASSGQTLDNGVGNVANTRLEGEEVLGKTTFADFVL